jgi:hypothetical protein
MNYRTWFRLIIKAMGVFVIILALAKLTSNSVNLLTSFFTVIRTGMASPDWRYWGPMLAEPGVMIALGLYLVFRGQWIVSVCCPADRCCRECGYNISKCQGSSCPECGLELPHGIRNPGSEK